MQPLAVKQIAQLFVDGDNATTPSDKGNKLVSIVKLLFSSIPGIKFVAENIVNDKGSVEIDLAFLNFQYEQGLFEFATIILVECKNWAAKVDAKAVRDFASKLERKRQTYGFMFCASGITGDEDEQTAAYDELRHNFAVKGIHILVFSRKELEECTCISDFLDAVRQKISDIIFRA